MIYAVSSVSTVKLLTETTHAFTMFKSKSIKVTYSDLVSTIV